MKPLNVPRAALIELCVKTLKNIQEVRKKHNKQLLHQHRRTYKKWIFFGVVRIETDDELISRLSADLTSMYPSRTLNDVYVKVRNMKSLVEISLEPTVELEADDTQYLLYDNEQFGQETQIDKYLKKHNLV